MSLWGHPGIFEDPYGGPSLQVRNDSGNYCYQSSKFTGDKQFQVAKGFNHRDEIGQVTVMGKRAKAVIGIAEPQKSLALTYLSWYLWN